MPKRLVFWSSKVAAAGLIALLASIVASAQTAQTGALTGTATDPSGRVLPGVTIKATSTTTGQSRSTVSQNNGKYLVPLLSPGAYKVEASRKDFRTAVYDQIRINVTETATLNL